MNDPSLDRRRAEYREDSAAGRKSAPVLEYLRSLCGVPGVEAGAHPWVRDHNTAVAGDDAGSGGLLLTVHSLAAGVGSLRGATVQTNVATDPAAALRPLSVVLSAGARLIEVGGPSVVLPAVAASISLQWLAEGVAPSAASEPAFGQVTSTPKRAAGWLDVSRQLPVQSPVVAMTTVLRDIAAATAQVLDQAALAGSGAGPEPAGILNTAGIGSFTFGGPATGADFTAAERTLAAAGVPPPYAVIASPATRKKLRGSPLSATLTSAHCGTRTTASRACRDSAAGTCRATASSSAASPTSKSSCGRLKSWRTRTRVRFKLRSASRSTCWPTSGFAARRRSP